MVSVSIYCLVLIALASGARTAAAAAASAAVKEKTHEEKLDEADVGFPEREHVDVERNKTRVPLYIPGRCPSNQLLYPGDQKNDWICDCMPGFAYYAPRDACFEVYKRGPCKQAEYLVLPPGQFNPICAANPCVKDGCAPFKGKCYTLLRPGGPCRVEEGIFGVNSTTLQLDCLKEVDRLSVLYSTMKTPRTKTLI